MDCEYCENKITEIPRPCRYCSHYFCTHCRLPESHNCDGLKRISESEKRKYQETMADLTSSHARVNDRGYEDIIDVEQGKRHYKQGEHKKHKEGEPYLYRYIPPKEQKKEQFHVDDKYKKEYVGTSRQKPKPIDKVKSFFIRGYHKTRSWLNLRYHRDRKSVV